MLLFTGALSYQELIQGEKILEPILRRSTTWSTMRRRISIQMSHNKYKHKINQAIAAEEKAKIPGEIQAAIPKEA